MGASPRSARSPNLLASGLVCAAAVVACNQLFSIEEPTPADTAGAGGSSLGGNAGSGVDMTHSSNSSGGSGGSDPTNTNQNSSLGGATTTGDGTGGDSSGGSGGTPSTSGTGGVSTGGSGGTPSTGGSGGAPSTGGSGGMPSTDGSGGTPSTGGATSSVTTASVTTASVTTASVTTASVTTASVTTASATTASATTGVVIPPDPCEGENLRGPALIEIAAGTGVIGNDVVEDNAFPVIHPDFNVFCIDETEVTVADYQECVDASRCDPPIADLPGQCPEDSARPDNHPVGCVDWARADAYCEWAGKRLPTEQEWEYAARGTEGRPFPWGDDPLSADRLNWNSVVGFSTPVKSYADGATPEGVYDMAGNVWEWTSSTWCSDYGSSPECDPTVHVPRGGSYVSIDRFVSPSYRDPDNAPDQRFGFRCAFGPVN